MDRGMRATGIGLLTLALVGCEGGGDPVQQAMGEAVASNRAAAHPLDPADLAPAAGPSLDQTQVAELIEDHRRTLTTAQAMAGSRDPEIRRLAQQATEASTAQIAALQAWEPAAR